MNVKSVKQALLSADGYKKAALFLYDFISKDGIRLVAYSSAMTVNICFAIEIYLKQLVEINNVSKPKIHELEGLFSALPDNVRTDIGKLYDEECQKSLTEYKYLSLDGCLKVFNKAFVDSRYIYEPQKNKSIPIAWKRIFVVAEVLESYIYNILENT